MMMLWDLVVDFFDLVWLKIQSPFLSPAQKRQRIADGLRRLQRHPELLDKIDQVLMDKAIAELEKQNESANSSSH